MALAEELDGDEEVCRGLLFLARRQAGIGGEDEALDTALRGVAQGAGRGLDNSYGGAVLGIAGRLLFRRGRWPEAQPLVRSGLSSRTEGIPALWLRALLVQLDAGQGRWREAAEGAQRCLEALDRAVYQPAVHAAVLAARAE